MIHKSREGDSGEITPLSRIFPPAIGVLGDFSLHVYVQYTLVLNRDVMHRLASCVFAKSVPHQVPKTSWMNVFNSTFRVMLPQSEALCLQGREITNLLLPLG